MLRTSTPTWCEASTNPTIAWRYPRMSLQSAPPTISSAASDSDSSGGIGGNVGGIDTPVECVEEVGGELGLCPRSPNPLPVILQQRQAGDVVGEGGAAAPAVLRGPSGTGEFVSKKYAKLGPFGALLVYRDYVRWLWTATDREKLDRAQAREQVAERVKVRGRQIDKQTDNQRNTSLDPLWSRKGERLTRGGQAQPTVF